MQWYIKVLKNYAVFQGRARRKEYWMFILINAVILFILPILETLIGLPGAISTLYSIAVFIPGVAVAVRRMHDTGKSGFWVLLNLIPLIGTLIFLIMAAFDSEAGMNKYGSNPKNETQFS